MSAIAYKTTGGVQKVVRSVDPAGQLWDSVNAPTSASTISSLAVGNDGSIVVGTRSSNYNDFQELWRLSASTGGLLQWYGPSRPYFASTTGTITGLHIIGSKLVAVKSEGPIFTTAQTTREMAGWTLATGVSSNGRTVSDPTHIYSTSASKPVWTDLAAGGAGALTSPTVDQLLVDHRQVGKVWAFSIGSPSKLYRSDDSGHTYGAPDTTPYPFTAAALGDLTIGDDGRIYAYGSATTGSSTTVYVTSRSTAAGSAWSTPQVMGTVPLTGAVMLQSPRGDGVAAAGIPDVWVKVYNSGSGVGKLAHFGTAVYPYTWGTGQWFGSADHGASAGDPVNTTYGNLHDSWTDLAAPAGIAGLDATRSYNSMSTDSSPLGTGWRSSYASTVAPGVNGAVDVSAPDGRVISYVPNGSGGWVQPLGFEGVLGTDGDGSRRVTFPDTSAWLFDTAGRLEELDDSSGNTVTISRDTAGRPTTATSSLGPSMTYSYNGSGQLTSVSSSDGRSVTYTYTSGRLATMTDAAGRVTTFGVDSAGHLSSITDGAGVVQLTVTYNSDGSVASQTTPQGGATFVYDFVAHTTTVTTSPGGEVMTYRHDGYGRISSIMDPSGNTASRTYDPSGWADTSTDRSATSQSSTLNAAGNPLTTTDPISGTTTYTYDSSQRPLTVTSPQSGTTIFTYTGANRVPSTITDALGHVTTQTVTADLVTSRTDADGVTETITYNALRLPTSVTDGAGNTTTMTYDAAGRVLSTTSPGGRVSSSTYDAAGNVLTQTAPDGGVTTCTYNSAGQQLTLTDPTGALTTNTYNTAGQLASTAKPGKPATTFVYDGLGQLTETHEPTGGGVSTTTYGVLGRVASSTDQLGNTTTYTYDVLGRLRVTTAPDGGETHTNYDTAGRLVTTIDPLGNTTTYTYLANGLVHTVTAPDGGVTTYGYDALGRRTSVTDPTGVTTSTSFTNGGRTHATTTAAGSTTVGYDAAGRQTSVTDPLGGVAHTAYNTDGDVTSSTSPAGLVTTYGYDSAGRQDAVTSPAGVVDSTTFSLRGEALTTHRTGRGTIHYTYNGDGTMASATNAKGDTSTYAYDALGRRTSQTDPAGGVQDWTYNAGGQMTAYSTPAPTLGGTRPSTAATYDVMGRVHTLTDPTGHVTTDTYNVGGQLTARSAVDGTSTQSWTWGYDASGRVTTSTGPSGSDTSGYDAAGRLLSSTTSDGRITSYAYDGAGRPVSLTAPDGTVWHNTLDANGRVTAVTSSWRLADTFTAPDGTAPDTNKWTSVNGTVTGNAAALGVSSATPSASIATLDQAADRDLRFIYKVADVTSANQATLDVSTRASGTDRYLVSIPSDSTTATVSAVTGAGAMSLGTFSLPSTGAGATRAMRVRQSGSSLSVWAWNPSGSEPVSPTFSVTDTSITAAGSAGFTSTAGAGANTFTVDDYRDVDPAGGPGAIDSYTYDADARPLTETLPNGTRTWTYTDGRVTGYAEALSTSSRTTTVGYNTSGGISSLADAGHTPTSFTYDAAGELTRSNGAVDVSWAYDNLGRRTAETNATTGVDTAYSYDLASRLTAATPTAGTATSYTYDNAGRRTSEATGTDATTYSYNPTGKLAQLVTPMGTQDRHYDNRDHLSVIDNTTSAGVATSRFDWSAASVPQVVGWQTGGATTGFPATPITHGTASVGAIATGLGQDVLGSVSDPSVGAGASYDAWGATSSPSLDPRLGYRGELTLGGLTNLRNRDYAPTVGGFTSVDPVADAAGSPTVGNQYHYALNNPLNLTDPLGLHADDSVPEGSTRPRTCSNFTLSFAGLDISVFSDGTLLGGGMGTCEGTSTAEKLLNGFFAFDVSTIGGFASLAKTGACLATFTYRGPCADAVANTRAMAAHNLEVAICATNPIRPGCTTVLKNELKRYACWDEGAKSGVAYAVGKCGPRIIMDVLALKGLAGAGSAADLASTAGRTETADSIAATRSATNTADDFANWGSEFVDDAIRAPATRPDFANISAKIERQMQTRGWTPDLIDEAVTSGNKFPAVNKLGGANTPATRYVSPTTGQSVVIDNATGEIIQVGGPGFKYGP
ncbi:MAG: DUF6531 domain-containing protein [Acidimicrobiales bacterium]